MRVEPVESSHGMVVAGHPEAAAAGLAILTAGGNAVDAAVAVALSLGVAEPYGSGLGGKLMLLYREAASRKTWAIEALDQSPGLDVTAYLARPAPDRNRGHGSVCVPGLAAGLWMAHQQWGRLPWRRDVDPAIQLARAGFTVLPRSRDFFAEQEAKLRSDPETARIYLPAGALPEVGSRLTNPDLADTMETLAAEGADGFYRGRVASSIVAASQGGGGMLTMRDLADYRAVLTEPVGVDFLGHRLLSGPPPTSGSALLLATLKVFETESFDGRELRTATNLDLLGRAWRQIRPLVQRSIADVPEAAASLEALLAPKSIDRLRAALGRQLVTDAGPWPDAGGWEEDRAAATSHFIVVDREGNVVSATQSLSHHFGSGVVPPGTGVILNNSMANFAYRDATGVNYVAPRKKPRSTIAPVIVLKENQPVLAIGVPGSSRIPTALLQVLLDNFVLGRPLAEAIGDTRFHFAVDAAADDQVSFQAEQSLGAEICKDLQARGWTTVLNEPAGRGLYYGGVTAVRLRPDGTREGYADPRRTNSAVGY